MTNIDTDTEIDPDELVRMKNWIQSMKYNVLQADEAAEEAKRALTELNHNEQLPDEEQQVMKQDLEENLEQLAYHRRQIVDSADAMRDDS